MSSPPPVAGPSSLIFGPRPPGAPSFWTSLGYSLPRDGKPNAEKKRTSAEAHLTTDDNCAATAGPSGAAARPAPAKRRRLELTEEDERTYERQRHRPQYLTAAQAAVDITILDPDHAFAPDEEQSPPRAPSWRERVAAKLDPALRIRDVNVYVPPLPDESEDDRGFDDKVRHPRWYLPTGDIAIGVGDCVFRVDRRILQPHVREESYDVSRAALTELWDDVSEEALPLYEWHGVTPVDVSLFLQMVYSPRTFFSRGRLFFEDLERMLVLSEQFQSLRLRECAIAGLGLVFPSSLGQYLRHAHKRDIVPCLLPSTYAPEGVPCLLPSTYALDALRLAIDYDVPVILLMAMYALADYQPRFLIHGIPDADGKKQRLLDMTPKQARQHAVTIARNERERAAAVAADPPRAPKIKEDPVLEQREILVRILAGRAKMQAAHREVILHATSLWEIKPFPDDYITTTTTRTRTGEEVKKEGVYRYHQQCEMPSKLTVTRDDIEDQNVMEGEGAKVWDYATWMTCAGRLKTMEIAMREWEAKAFAEHDRYLPLPSRAMHMPALAPLLEYTCTVCGPKLDREMREGQFKLWTKLPGFFGMEGWFEVAHLQARFSEEYARRYLGADYDERSAKGWEQALYAPDTSRLSEHPRPSSSVSSV